MMKHWIDTYTTELERLEKVLAKYEEIKKTCDSPSLEKKNRCYKSNHDRLRYCFN